MGSPSSANLVDAQRLLDLLVLVEAPCLVGQDQVGAHATAGEVPDAVAVLGAVRVGVEVPHALPAGVLEELDDIEGVTDALGAEAEVLVELPDPLGVEVDVKELVVPERLRDGVREGQTAHRLVGELGVQAHHVGVFERSDEGQCVADGREEDVPAGLVRLGFEGDAQAEITGADVLTDEVDGLLVAIERKADILCRLGLDAFASTPHDEDVGAQFRTQFRRLAGLLDCEPADTRVVGGERSLLEDRAPEEVGRDHRDVQARGVECPPEPLDDVLALGGRRAEGHEVVVVEADAVGTEVRQVVHGVDRVERRPYLTPEGVAALVADGPQAEGEVVLRVGVKGSLMVLLLIGHR